MKYDIQTEIEKKSNKIIWLGARVQNDQKDKWPCYNGVRGDIQANTTCTHPRMTPCLGTPKKGALEKGTLKKAHEARQNKGTQ